MTREQELEERIEEQKKYIKMLEDRVEELVQKNGELEKKIENSEETQDQLDDFKNSMLERHKDSFVEEYYKIKKIPKENNPSNCNDEYDDNEKEDPFSMKNRWA